MTIKHKVFAAYSVLKAEDVNTYLMNQAAVGIDLESELTGLPASVKVAYVSATGLIYAKTTANAWQVIYSGDSGWQTLTPGTGIAAGARGMFYRVIGQVCYWEIGANSSAWTAGKLITNFPVGVRPSKTHEFTGIFDEGATNRAVSLGLGADGNLLSSLAFAGSTIPLTASGSFPIG